MPYRAQLPPGPLIGLRELWLYGGVNAVTGAAFVATSNPLLLGVSVVATIVPCVRILWSQPQ